MAYERWREGSPAERRGERGSSDQKDEYEREAEPERDRSSGRCALRTCTHHHADPQWDRQQDDQEDQANDDDLVGHSPTVTPVVRERDLSTRPTADCVSSIFRVRASRLVEKPRLLNLTNVRIQMKLAMRARVGTSPQTLMGI